RQILGGSGSVTVFASRITRCRGDILRKSGEGVDTEHDDHAGTIGCGRRVQATLKPSSDSNIKMEIWLPVAASWNGKLRGTGNGGLGGGATVGAGPLA